MSTPGPSRTVVRRTIAGAAIGCALALALFVALPPRGEPLPQLFEFLGRFHTLAVHLPIGVLLLIATAELVTRSPRVRERVDPALDLALPFLVLASVGAFSLGILLARGNGYPPKLVALHRGFTLGAVLGSAACLLAWVTRVRADGVERRAPYRVMLASTVLLLTIGAHFGGSLTHGETYLTRYAPAFMQEMIGGAPPAPPPDPVAAAPSSEPLVFASSIAPILKRECVSCHGPDKTKGGLRLDSLAGILKGGEHGAAAVPGHGAESPLVKRMRLPATEDEHMPPTEKPQPAAGEIDLLTWWIDRGANDTLRVKDAIVPDGARTILGRSIDHASILDAPEPVPAPTKSAPEATPAAAASQTPAPSSTAGGRLAYRDVVAPILAANCGKCHGEAKQKGKLRVDSIAALVAGGKNGAGIVAGDGARGTVLARVRLPSSDDKHMPPADEHQLSSGQLAALVSWVSHGANETTLASALTGGGASRATVVNAKGASPDAPRATTLAKASAPANSTPAAIAPIDVGPGQVALYRDVVAPLLARRCGECHSGKHDEGGMRVDDLAALLKDEEVIPGKPESSPVAKRMALAASDSDRMPPPEKPPADAWETAAVSMWIARGAKADLVIASSELPAGVAQAMSLGSAAAPPPAAPTPAPAAAASAAPSLPPGAVIEPRAAGCGACTVGAEARGSSVAAFPAIAVGILALARRRRGNSLRRSRARA